MKSIMFQAKAYVIKMNKSSLPDDNATTFSKMIIFFFLLKN